MADRQRDIAPGCVDPERADGYREGQKADIGGAKLRAGSRALGTG
jgi:hypothetical protein